MIVFISGLLISLTISFICWLICIISYPSEYEAPEDFLQKESIFFIAAWVALAILAIPAAFIINKLLSHE